jgi:apolipoprotein N-acyltransferase
VFQRHLDATAAITAGSADLVVWPENVVDVTRFGGSEQLGAIAAQARRIGAPFAVGVTEDAGPDHFLNAQVVVAPDGTVTSRYDKVRRVPFGEYMPLRTLLHAIGAPTDLVPRDAVAGHGPAVLDLPNGTRVAVVISWEVFFGGRANEGVEHGGTFLINPTNGSSYTWTVLQSQQIASSRLRAVEQGRWVVQVAPTGFSAFVTPSGAVIDRTAVSEERVLSHVVVERTGRTWYSRLGNKPVVAVLLVVLGGACLAGTGPFRRRRRSSPARR